MGHNSNHDMGGGAHRLPPNAARKYPETRQWPPHVAHAHAGTPGTAICTGCHAIWQRKRWHLDEAAYAQMLEDATVSHEVCPACRQIEQRMYDGEVFIESPLVQTDGDAIAHLLRNTEARIRQNNPLARLAAVETRGERMHVLTITPFLAERVGKELQKAYDGHLVIEHAERERFTRVFWSRDAQAPFR